jgi:hypothetical protein
MLVELAMRCLRFSGSYALAIFTLGAMLAPTACHVAPNPPLPSCPAAGCGPGKFCHNHDANPCDSGPGACEALPAACVSTPTCACLMQAMPKPMGYMNSCVDNAMGPQWLTVDGADGPDCP